MRRRWQRLVRILRQSRIRLPRAPLQARDLVAGDWLIIASHVWRVREIRPASHSTRVLILEAAETAVPTARLVAPAAGDGSWILIRGGQRLAVPRELLVALPSPACGPEFQPPPESKNSSAARRST